jgi:hypothetical protein
MAAITTRELSGTGATVSPFPLTNAQIDTNFININTELGQKLPLSGGTITGPVTLNNLTAGSVLYLDALNGVVGNTNLTFDATNFDVKATLRLKGSISGHAGFAPAANAGNIIFTLPASDGLSGQVLSTNGSGTLQWVNPTTIVGGGLIGSGTSTGRTSFTATLNQTTFSVQYVVGQVDVYLNGVKLINGTEFTATNGTTVVLSSGCAAGDRLEAVVYTTQWILDGTSLYYNGGSVGLGTNTPAAKLSLGNNAASRKLLIYDNNSNSTYAGLGTPDTATLDIFTFTGGTIRLGEWTSGSTFSTRISISSTDTAVNGTVTLNSGTINQVQYLNGSKTLTGSANLTFDGTRLTAANITDSSLTSGRVVYSTTGGDLTDSTNLTFNGTTLTVNTISHSGLTPTSGTNVDQLTTVIASLTLNTNWQDTGIDASDLATGSYVVQLFADDSGVGGGHFTEYYTGFMSWYGSGTNDGTSDEILLHRAGHAPNAGQIFLRTLRVLTGNLKLQIAGATTNSGASNYTFKFRRLI